MDASRFDAWTRRRFSFVTGTAFVATLSRFTADAGAGNRGKKRKPRCKRRFDLCTPGGKRKCCGTLKCQVPYDIQDGNSSETHCCYLEGHTPCSVHNDCCYPAYCSGPGGACVVNSDRNLKTNFASVDPLDMLTRVAALPIATWNYTADDPAIRHIGPMAQDFAAQFGVGTDDRHIHPVDGQGVALAAIQGLAALAAELRAENEQLAQRIALLEGLD